MTDLLLRAARVWGHPGATDLRIRAGHVAEIGTGLAPAPGDAVEDLPDALLLPGLVDSHAHLDKTLMGGPWVPHESGPGLIGKIRNGQERRSELGIPDPRYIGTLARRMVALGTTHVRSHVDVDPLLGIDAVHAVREAVAGLGGALTAELVAFPQAGLLTAPGTEGLLADALEAGVEIIGGIDPAGLDNDPVRHLDVVFGLAERFGVGVDIHLHDGGSLGAWQFGLIIERTRALGLAGKVTISHAFALHDADAATRVRLIDGLAEAGVSLTSVAPVRVLPLADLRAAGVPMGLGNDGIRDLWSPFGTGDMLERAMFCAKNSGYATDPLIETALDAATSGGARVMGITGYGLSVGAAADVVAVPARTAAEAVVMRPTRTLVVKGGVVVARNGEYLEDHPAV
ncbi:cytosine deaminase [Stackebrandtia albiflava]|uniref:Cytosine deaminase n=1 Tax=Stackebrandtia albiflava TaxID=406432 RepID=A0A562V9W3_9ACTN|nr:amidohydrolase [Stackebrandtia albiflava]TWJ14638.1 cytosine deaminase [Stackebrandtia albiflava]